MKILGIGKDKSDNWNIMLARQDLIYYSFFNPKLDAVNM